MHPFFRILYRLLVSAALTVLPLSLRAQETSGFTLLNSGLPSVLNTASLPEFLRGLFQVSIAAAGVLAVIMIAIAGIQYMGTDAYSSKEQAKERIRGAVLGLLIIFGSFVFLRTINPDIVSLRFVLERITYRDDSAFWEGLNDDETAEEFSTQNIYGDATREAFCQREENKNDPNCIKDVFKRRCTAGNCECAASYVKVGFSRNGSDVVCVKDTSNVIDVRGQNPAQLVEFGCPLTNTAGQQLSSVIADTTRGGTFGGGVYECIYN